MNAVKFSNSSAKTYTTGTQITSANLNSIQAGIIYNTHEIEQMADTIDGINILYSELKEAIENLKNIIYTDIQVAVAAWEKDSTYKNYPYAATLSIPKATTDMAPYIFFSQEMIDDLALAPTCDCGNGVIQIYAMNQATKAYTIPKIVLQKGN